LYHDRALLERGSGTFELGTSFQVEAGALRISSTNDSSARIGLRGVKTVQIAALLGSVQVQNLFGLVVANVPAGEAFEFTAPPADEDYVTKMTGRVRKEGAKYFLEDEISKVQAELRGDAVAKHAGQRVMVSGVMRSGANGTPILQVSELTPVASDSKRRAGGGAGAAGGISHTAVIAGVVVAGAGAGAAIAITHATGGNSSASQPLSPSRP